jgi:hypothetical protein
MSSSKNFLHLPRAYYTKYYANFVRCIIPLPKEIYCGALIGQTKLIPWRVVNKIVGSCALSHFVVHIAKIFQHRGIIREHGASAHFGVLPQSFQIRY